MSIRKLRAFTLLELIVVIVILGLLAALAIPTFLGVINRTKLKTAEVTAASLARETVAIAAFRQEGVTRDDVEAAAADLPGRTEAHAGVYAANEYEPVSGYQVVYGNWEFSGHERTVSVKLAQDGDLLGVAVGVPNVGCAFARAEDSKVTNVWSVSGVSVANCNGALALSDGEIEIPLLSPPPTPGGLKLEFGTCEGAPGWKASWTSPPLVDVYVNGKWVGTATLSTCVKGTTESDEVLIIPRDPSAPVDEPSGWEGGAGEYAESLDEDNGSTPGGGVATGPSAPVQTAPGEYVNVTWPVGSVPPGAVGVIVDRQDQTGSNNSSTGVLPPTTTNNGSTGYHYDQPGEGEYSYVVQPVDSNGNPVGPSIKPEVKPTPKPQPLPEKGENGEDGLLALVDGSSVTLLWAGVADTPTAPLTGYRVYRAASTEGPWSQIGENAKTSTSFVDSGLAPGVYCYAVTAYGLGGESAKSVPACVEIIPTAPTNPTPTPPQQSDPPTGISSSRFGTDIVVEGNTMVVSAFDENTLQLGGGAVYTYTRVNGSWTLQSTLRPPVAYQSTAFGASLAIEGDTLVVGSSGDQTNGVNKGSVYVYTRSGNTWVDPVKVTANDGAARDGFGSEVALDGDTLAVGAPADDDRGTDTGSIYVFKRSGNTWVQDAKILPSKTTTTLNTYGKALALEGDLLVAGSSRETSKAQYSGAVYVYDGSAAWKETKKLIPADLMAGSLFGTSVALDGGVLAVGSSSATSTAYISNAGAVYIYSTSNWALTQKIVSTNAKTGSTFGSSVALDGSSLVVGSPYDSDLGYLAGAVYVFKQENGSWVEKSKTIPTGYASVNQAQFGTVVATDGSNLAVGSAWVNPVYTSGIS